MNATKSTRNLCAVGLVFNLGFVWSACGVTQFQTARTVPPGSGQVSVGLGYLYNSLLSKRKHSVANFPVEVHTRWGLVPKLDLGVSVFDLAGGQVDTKYNFLPDKCHAALALSGGLGAAWDWAGAGFIKLPITLHFSYDVPNIITPYVALGWQANWVIGYEGADVPDAPGLQEPSGRPTYGDHLLTATAGLAIHLDSNVRLLLEYDYSHPLLDDPQDGHKFVDNHVFAVGISMDFSFRKKPETGPPASSPPGSIIPPPVSNGSPSGSVPNRLSNRNRVSNAPMKASRAPHRQDGNRQAVDPDSNRDNPSHTRPTPKDKSAPPKSPPDGSTSPGLHREGGMSRSES